jgi:hypothetical protein
MATSKRPSDTYLTNQRRKLGAQQAGRRASTPPTTNALPPRSGTSAGNGKAVAQRTATAVGQRARLDVARLKGLGRYMQHQWNQADKQIPKRNSPVVTTPNTLTKPTSRPTVGPRRQITGSTAGKSRVGNSSAPYGEGTVRRVSVTDVSGPKSLPPGKSNKALPPASTPSSRRPSAQAKLDSAAKGSTGPNRVGRPSIPKTLPPGNQDKINRRVSAQAKLDSAAKGSTGPNRVASPARQPGSTQWKMKNGSTATSSQPGWPPGTESWAKSPTSSPAATKGGAKVKSSGGTQGSKGGALAIRPKEGSGAGKGLIGGLLDAGIRLGTGQDIGHALAESTGGNVGARIGAKLPGGPVVKAVGAAGGYLLGSGAAGKALDWARDNLTLSDRGAINSPPKSKAGPSVPPRLKQKSALSPTTRPSASRPNPPSSRPSAASQAPSRAPQQESRPTMRQPISSASGSTTAKAPVRPSMAAPQPQQTDTPKLTIPTSSQGSGSGEWTPPNDPNMYQTDNKKVRYNKAFVDNLPDMSRYDRKKKKG